MKKIEKLTFVNERGESLIFSHASIYHANEVSGLSDMAIATALFSGWMVIMQKFLIKGR